MLLVTYDALNIPLFHMQALWHMMLYSKFGNVIILFLTMSLPIFAFFCQTIPATIELLFQFLWLYSTLDANYMSYTMVSCSHHFCFGDTCKKIHCCFGLIICRSTAIVLDWTVKFCFYCRKWHLLLSRETIKSQVILFPLLLGEKMVNLSR